MTVAGWLRISGLGGSEFPELTQGKTPYWPDILPSRIIQPTAACAGIQKHIGWRAGTHAARDLPVHTGDLFPGTNSGEAGRAASDR